MFLKMEIVIANYDSFMLAFHYIHIHTPDTLLTSIKKYFKKQTRYISQFYLPKFTHLTVYSIEIHHKYL